MLKKFLFFQSTLGLFITVSSGVLISPLIFPIIFWVFSSFIAFFHFTNFRVFRHTFVSCFHITSDFYYIFSRVFISPTFFGMTVFCQVLRFCFIALRVLRIRERFFFLLSGDFYLTLLPHICHSTVSSTDFRELFLVSDVNLHSFQTFDTTCFYQCFPRSRQFLLEGCRASH